MKISDEELSTLTQEIVIKELQSTEYSKIIKIFAFKFLVYFRNQIPQDWYPSIVDILFKLIATNDELYVNGCLLVLDKFLGMKDLKNLKVYQFESCLLIPETYSMIINGLYGLIKIYNVEAMKCFYKFVFLNNDQIFNDNFSVISGVIIEVYKIILSIKPDNFEPTFNHEFFELIAFCLKKIFILNSDSYNSFKQVLNDNLNLILSNNIIDLFNYLFQIFALELSLDNDYNSNQVVSIISSKTLFNYIINTGSWNLENKYLFESLTDYLKLLLISNSQLFTTNNYMNNILEIIINVSIIYCNRF